MTNIKELEFLISSQEEQEKMGNLTPLGINYLNGLRTAYKICSKQKLPTEQEIYNKAKEVAEKEKPLDSTVLVFFFSGATWMRDQIQ